MAVSAERIEITYYKLRELYKTQKPELIIVDTYLAGADTVAYEEQKREYLHYSIDLMRFNYNKIGAVNSIISEKNRPYYLFKLLYYHTNWKKILKNYGGDHLSDNLIMNNSKIGFKKMKCINDMDLDLIKECEDIVKQDENNCIWMINPYLVKIAMLAKQNNSKVLFVCHPKKVAEYEVILFEALKQYLKNEKDIYFLNMCKKIEEINLNPKTDFADENHLNFFGAKKTTKYLTNYIQSLNISFEDKGYDYIWEEAYKEYKKYEIKNFYLDKSLFTKFEKITNFIDLN